MQDRRGRQNRGSGRERRDVVACNSEVKLNEEGDVRVVFHDENQLVQSGIGFGR